MEGCRRGAGTLCTLAHGTRTIMNKECLAHAHHQVAQVRCMGGGGGSNGPYAGALSLFPATFRAAGGGGASLDPNIHGSK